MRSFLPNRRIKTYSPDRQDRLVTNWAARGVGWDFSSLVWERRKSFLSWRPHITLTATDFRLPNNLPRWVHEVHSFDPSEGVAILKIGEGDAPDNAPVVTFTYSWRKWDLIKNREIGRLQDCVNPFDPFTRANDRAA